MYDLQSMVWHPLLREDVRATALAVAHATAHRLREPEQIAAAAARAAQQTSFPRATYWQPAGLAQGYAGLALMCSYLDACFPGECWDRVGHRYLAHAVEGAERLPQVAPGLWSGLSGLALAACALGRGGTRYLNLLSQLDARLLPQIAGQIRALSGQHGVAVAGFDTITGLAGMGAYLLCRRSSALAEETLCSLLASLVALSDSPHGVPHWYTPPRLIADESMREQYPDGVLNCGLAHGIPGPLALLSLAYLDGLRVAGLRRAIDSLAQWLVEQQVIDAWGVNWPTAVPLKHVNGVLQPGRATHTGRAAWCYGSPGLIRALWLAGEALDNAAYRELAIEGLEAVGRRPASEQRIFAPTFCHGVAGLLQITLRFAHDTQHASFTDAAHTLCSRVLAFHDTEFELGFYNVEPGGGRVEQPGLLDGVPGVVLALLASVSAIEPSWDRAFLLA